MNKEYMNKLLNNLLYAQKTGDKELKARLLTELKTLSKSIYNHTGSWDTPDQRLLKHWADKYIRGYESDDSGKEFVDYLPDYRAEYSQSTQSKSPGGTSARISAGSQAEKVAAEQEKALKEQQRKKLEQLSAVLKKSRERAAEYNSYNNKHYNTVYSNYDSALRDTRMLEEKNKRESENQKLREYSQQQQFLRTISPDNHEKTVQNFRNMLLKSKRKAEEEKRKKAVAERFKQLKEKAYADAINRGVFKQRIYDIMLKKAKESAENA